MQGKSKLLGRALAALALIGASLATQAVQAVQAVPAGTMHWLRLEHNFEVAAFYADVARRFEAANPGTKVELQFLENESYR